MPIEPQRRCEEEAWGTCGRALARERLLNQGLSCLGDRCCDGATRDSLMRWAVAREEARVHVRHEYACLCQTCATLMKYMLQSIYLPTASNTHRLPDRLRPPERRFSIFPGRGRQALPNCCRTGGGASRPHMRGVLRALELEALAAGRGFGSGNKQRKPSARVHMAESASCAAKKSSHSLSSS